jgi:hypothetical protein
MHFEIIVPVREDQKDLLKSQVSIVYCKDVARSWYLNDGRIINIHIYITKLRYPVLPC